MSTWNFICNLSMSDLRNLVVSHQSSSSMLPMSRKEKIEEADTEIEDEDLAQNLKDICGEVAAVEE